MKTLKIILLATAVLLLPAYAHSSLGFARISFLQGDVQVRTPEAGEWMAAAVNTPVDEGDELWVPEGARVELQLNGGTSIRLDRNTALEILTLEKTSSQFYLSEGRVYVDHNAARGKVIQFDTPGSSVRAYDRSVFGVDVSDQFVDVSVFTGSVDAEGRDGKTRVNAGRTLTLGDGRNAELAPVGQRDEWENWNRERDRRYASRGDSYRYLPDELRSYSNDFDDSGKWVQVGEYGTVWTPRATPKEWAPYRTGRWMWRGGDYVWISYEPWGWAPYHYGRWAFVPVVGWFWVPPPRGEVYWGPGYVGWVRTADHVAWVPLAPRETYYGYGNFGPHSVDIRRPDSRQINVTNITYRNVQVNNSVTIINHNTFVTGRQETVNIKQNVFLTEKVSIGRPDIKPEKASFAPAIKVIEPAKLPPQHVNKIEVKALKQERRLEKEQTKSVINRGAPAKALVVKTVEQPKSPAEKAKERQQTKVEKGTTAEPVGAAESKAESQAERKATKGIEEKSASPAVVPETKETKQTRETKQTKDRQLGREEKEKPAAGPEAKVKGDEKSGKAAISESRESRGAVESKSESQAERKVTKGAEEKSARPAIVPETKETKQTKDRRQLAREEKEKPAAGPSGVSDTRNKNKAEKQALAQEKRKSTEQELKKGNGKVRKEAAESKEQSSDTAEEKLQK
ncbi:MAG TPA: DUF6600 domain-containing protein [Candidatus Binatia bacterium]